VTLIAHILHGACSNKYRIVEEIHDTITFILQDCMKQTIYITPNIL